MTVVAKRPDLEARRFLLAMSIVPPPRHSGSDTVDALRRDWQLAVKAFATRDKVASVIEREIPGPDVRPLRIRAYVPRKKPSGLPVVAYFHGGGFVFGDLYTAGATARALARRTDAIVVTVEYRLAPEYGLQDGRADCQALVDWLAEHADELGGDPARLAVAGDSAGGGIAAVVAQTCRDRGLELKAQVLIYPVTDNPHAHNTDPVAIGLLTPERVDWITAQISKVNDLTDPSQTALHAEDLTGLAPTILVTCGFDPLRDEGLAYKQRLQEAGVTLQHLHYPGMIHGFVTLDRVLSAGGHALDLLGDGLRAAFNDNLKAAERDNLPGFRLVNPLKVDAPQRMREVQVGTLVAVERFRQLRHAITEVREGDEPAPLAG
ncbi:alpha/beta hydrolase [Kribbia dieselivorans]|uniref:alpha/beta hydrolase n=1 Tax=Kribbia dieselivorans TaxID=331526 RepID=UPI0008389545|nr:alpha/beta hydrolase [Kribbia dieselivorans]